MSNRTSKPRAGRLRQQHFRNLSGQTASARPPVEPFAASPKDGFKPPIGPEHLSPRSSTSEAADSDSDSSRPPNSRSDSSDDEVERSRPQRPQPPPPPPPSMCRTERMRIVISACLIVEELGSDESDFDLVEVIRPHTIEYADSERSRSRSRPPRGLDERFVNTFEDLNCSDSDEEYDLDAAHEEFIKKLRAEKKARRMTQGSVSKRTISERGSDDDTEDLRPPLDFNEPGSSARRLRRRLDTRRSLIFSDPPPPRIDELEEPPSSEDDSPQVLDASELLARELPYYHYDTMEVDSDPDDDA